MASDIAPRTKDKKKLQVALPNGRASDTLFGCSHRRLGV
jgi:hypothetical protein